MPPRREPALPASAFVAVFGLYGAFAILPLILGLGAAVAATSPNLAASFVLWARSGGVLDGVWRAMVAAAPLSQPPRG